MRNCDETTASQVHHGRKGTFLVLVMLDNQDCVQEMKVTDNYQESKRIYMDLAVISKSRDCPHIVQCFGFILTSVSRFFVKVIWPRFAGSSLHLHGDDGHLPRKATLQQVPRRLSRRDHRQDNARRSVRSPLPQREALDNASGRKGDSSSRQK